MRRVDAAGRLSSLVLVVASVTTGASVSAKESLPWSTGLGETSVGYTHGPIPIGDDAVWVHQLEFNPRWRPTDWLELDARIHWEQGRFKAPDSTEQVEWDGWSDLLLTVSSPGVTVPVLGLRTGGGVQLLLPTSGSSQEATLVAGVGVMAQASRDFALLEGLELSYLVRYTENIHRYTTAQVCNAWFCETGRRNVARALAHGPSLKFRPWRSLTLSGSLLFTKAQLYPFAPLPFDPGTRSLELDGLWCSASVSWRAAAPLSIEAGITSNSFSVLPEEVASARLDMVFFLRFTLYPVALVERLAGG
ncbi:MAG: hypothetical protein QM765_33375 [Myxococcales bacterium]